MTRFRTFVLFIFLSNKHVKNRGGFHSPCLRVRLPSSPSREAITGPRFGHIHTIHNKPEYFTAKIYYIILYNNRKRRFFYRPGAKYAKTAAVTRHKQFIKRFGWEFLRCRFGIRTFIESWLFWIFLEFIFIWFYIFKCVTVVESARKGLIRRENGA